jgi:hypothetical protein
VSPGTAAAAAAAAGACLRLVLQSCNERIGTDKQRSMQVKQVKFSLPAF